ncbi:MAG: hypothetical protein C5B52_03920 [Bacteroidetes bacterium]|nr:MAG: hypothetical protein C5B52_03920 [Bacteroidota bacterium]
MIKVIYLACLMTTSFLLFVFSKGTEAIPCRHHSVGTIKEVSEGSKVFLTIVTESGEQLRAISLKENVILTSGRRVDVAYNIDSSNIASGNFIPVHIGSVTYLP